jgi:hypothetical protein
MGLIDVVASVRIRPKISFWCFNLSRTRVVTVLSIIARIPAAYDVSTIGSLNKFCSSISNRTSFLPCVSAGVNLTILSSTYFQLTFKESSGKRTEYFLVDANLGDPFENSCIAAVMGG